MRNGSSACIDFISFPLQILAAVDTFALPYTLSVQMCLVLVVATPITGSPGISTFLLHVLQLEELIHTCGV